jgi:hypothetical protein
MFPLSAFVSTELGVTNNTWFFNIPIETPQQLTLHLETHAAHSVSTGGTTYKMSGATWIDAFNTGMLVIAPLDPDVAVESASGRNYADPEAIKYNFDGFHGPVTNAPVMNKKKAGAAVPVQFSLEGDHGLDIFSDEPSSQGIACESGEFIDDVAQTVTAGNSTLQHDPETGSYTYVWKTDTSWANTCRQLTIALKDGMRYRANFQFK